MFRIMFQGTSLVFVNRARTEFSDFCQASGSSRKIQRLRKGDVKILNFDSVTISSIPAVIF